jgi:hypothetical protein
MLLKAAVTQALKRIFLKNEIPRHPRPKIMVEHLRLELGGCKGQTALMRE